MAKRFVSNDFVNVPNMFRWCMSMKANSIEPSARDVGARMFMLAAQFPNLTGLEIKDVAEGKLVPDLDYDEETATFTLDG